ncbi:DUF6611 family protein [Mycolicibacterium goodii]|uniref:Uncharacterized protein n=1 Tax=Mycolicibacterium goodii TaxID=134601 RepID=A0A0K0X617_MYCGD|nr:hypothetical protein AFA91_13535 [Mycolicibacterium goodii]
MDACHAQPGLLQRLIIRVLDGARRWGSVEIRPTRFGVVEYRLVVYPPGMDAAERRWTRVARGWPGWGLALWFICPIWLTTSMPTWAAVATSTAITLGAGAVAAALAGEARTQVRTLLATTIVGHDDETAIAARDRLSDLASTLLDADDRLDRGELEPVEYEAIWWRVYRRMDDAASPHPTA